MAVVSFALMSVLMACELIWGDANPHIGMFAFLIAPTFTVAGVGMAVSGWVLGRLRRQRLAVVPSLDKVSPIMLAILAAAGATLLSLSSYRGYHYTESVTFCGAACHGVMQPEMVAFQKSPHALMSCSACHVGPGFEWFFKTKLNGLRMAYHYVVGDYSRAIKPPNDSMRHPDETCGGCHRTNRELPDRRFVRTYFLSDASNTPWTIDMWVGVGSAGRSAHWHTTLDHKVEFIATDAERTVIPWVRLTELNGRSLVFQTTVTNEALTPAAVAMARPRTMDCLDCHNRIGHTFLTPEEAINSSMADGRLDRSLPAIRLVACALLTNKYTSIQDASDHIERTLRGAYPEAGSRLTAAITEVQHVYRDNFFPSMRTDWHAHPDHMGHMSSPGCFRCHDGKHVSDTGEVIQHDCDLCHTFMKQGKGMKPTGPVIGPPFEHPEDLGNRPLRDRCTRCHKGMPIT